jgi:hypothetical protein
VGCEVGIREWNRLWCAGPDSNRHAGEGVRT